MHTILVIEDDHDTRVSLRSTLEEEGFFVFSAGNGVQALKLLHRIKPPRLILLDLAMPVMSGESFLKELEADSEVNMIPVVLVSAYPDRAKVLIAREFVKKPIDLKSLMDTIRKHCS